TVMPDPTLTSFWATIYPPIVILGLEPLSAPPVCTYPPIFMFAPRLAFPTDTTLPVMVIPGFEALSWPPEFTEPLMVDPWDRLVLPVEVSWPFTTELLRILMTLAVIVPLTVLFWSIVTVPVDCMLPVNVLFEPLSREPTFS